MRGGCQLGSEISRALQVVILHAIRCVGHERYSASTTIYISIFRLLAVSSHHYNLT